VGEGLTAAPGGRDWAPVGRLDIRQARIRVVDTWFPIPARRLPGDPVN